MIETPTLPQARIDISVGAINRLLKDLPESSLLLVSDLVDNALEDAEPMPISEWVLFLDMPEKQKQAVISLFPANELVQRKRAIALAKALGAAWTATP